jgi:hypothetical protein
MASFITEESLLFFKTIEAPANGLPPTSTATPLTDWAHRVPYIGMINRNKVKNLIIEAFKVYRLPYRLPGGIACKLQS